MLGLAKKNPKPARGRPVRPNATANGNQPASAPRALVTQTGTGKVRRTITLDGPDPFASRWWDGLAERTALELSGSGAPASIRVGMKGSPEVTFYGWGPLQPLAIAYAAPNAFAAENAGQALPATNAPVNAPLSQTRSIVQQFGL